jgi:hypothetical protein
MEWIEVSKRTPPPKVRVLATDRHYCMVAYFDPPHVTKLPEHYKIDGNDWTPDGITGYDLDVMFTPTHWAYIDEELPK